MRLQNVAQHHLHRLHLRYPGLRYVSLTTTLLTLVWLYAIWWGERSVYNSSIAACDWDKWEEWPREATPHHLVLIADPQLVDPHTYPGRPWPLSTLTERYTDRYMARNFRLINAVYDPDSVFFLGDLFDGGREWPPESAKMLGQNGRSFMEEFGVLAPEGKPKSKRSMQSYRSALAKSHANPVTKKDHNIGSDGTDLKAFRPGEDGKFVKWGSGQWYKDLARFAKIFYDPKQVYPHGRRTMLPAYEVQVDPVSVQNGATNGAKREFATSGGKSRKLVSSLPGNHDVGFGAGVLLSVRDRFESHFGGGNRVDVIGNHTVISVDSPSLSAHSQYMSSGWESEEKHWEKLKHLWQPAWDFVEDLNRTAEKTVREALREYFPEDRTKGLSHEVMDPHDPAQIAALKESIQEAKRAPHLPVLLLSHVPLFRNPDTECGPMRERGHALSIQFGYQYQNVLTQSLSKDLVSKVSTAGDIAMIFSGDDHDYCDIWHRYNIAIPGTKAYFPTDDSLQSKYTSIREITVKSFSWAMGVRKPGFLMVSLWNPIDAKGKTIGTPLPTVQTHNCLLPDQLTIFIDYALLFLITLPILLLHAIVRVLRNKDTAPSTSLLPRSISLPRFQPNGALHKKSLSSSSFTSQNRHARGHSISTSHQNAGANVDSAHLSVQRSTNARARSVSPAYGGNHNQKHNHNQYHLPQQSGTPHTGPLIDRAGFFPQVRWMDPEDEESDEESIIGGEKGGMLEAEEEEEDSQAKWKWRQRTKGRVRRVIDAFVWDLGIVGLPGAAWYFWIIGNG